jgi:hypothetical protein
MQVPMRQSSTVIREANNMTQKQTEILYEYMRIFEEDPQNMESTYKLFREFNKHGMYISVIRLFYKNNLDQVSPTKTFYDQMRSQFDYAKDHIEQIKVT